ncbi:polymer-forming cytoskeletal protein [Candidatus Uhrbacteria bacterium]|nr:polymer-forming cytoskeletal protein [Candidatus Uhrbacteria bacterium]
MEFNKPGEKAEFETIIGPTVKVEGDFIGDGNVLVEGLVNGNLHTGKHVVVTEQAKITANITAQTAKIAGEVTGNVKISGRLELAGSAKVSGDIEAGTLSMEAGAQFNGKCTMTDKAAAK